MTRIGAERRVKRGVRALVVAGGLVACSKAETSPPLVPTKVEPAPASSVPSEPSASAARETSEPPAAPPAEAPKPSALERIRTLCAEGCSKMEGRCKEASVDVCRVNCENFESDGERCPFEVEDALACQAEADDVIPCSNTAAESCVRQYRAMRECTMGRVPPRQASEGAQTEAPEDVPDGFARVSDARLGLSLLFPEPLVRASGEEALRLSATLGEFEFRAETLPIAVPNPTDKTILKTALDFLGFACQSKLRLHGRFESEGVIHVRFDTACKDGVEWHGAFHFLDQRVAVTAVRAKTKPSNPIPHFEDFLFSVRRASEK